MYCSRLLYLGKKSLIFAPWVMWNNTTSPSWNNNPFMFGISNKEYHSLKIKTEIYKWQNNFKKEPHSGPFLIEELILKRWHLFVIPIWLTFVAVCMWRMHFIISIHPSAMVHHERIHEISHQKTVSLPRRRRCSSTDP